MYFTTLKNKIGNWRKAFFPSLIIWKRDIPNIIQVFQLVTCKLLQDTANILCVQLSWRTNVRKRNSPVGVFHLVNCKNVSPISGTTTPEQKSLHTWSTDGHPQGYRHRLRNHSGMFCVLTYLRAEGRGRWGNDRFAQMSTASSFTLSRSCSQGRGLPHYSSLLCTESKGAEGSRRLTLKEHR